MWLGSGCLDISKQNLLCIRVICKYLLVYVLNEKGAESSVVLYLSHPAVGKFVWGPVQDSTEDDDALEENNCINPCGTAPCCGVHSSAPLHETQKEVNLYRECLWCGSIDYH